MNFIISIKIKKYRAEITKIRTDIIPGDFMGNDPLFLLFHANILTYIKFKAKVRVHPLSRIVCVSVSQGNCNKLPQMVWLKTKVLYSLTILEDGNLK